MTLSSTQRALRPGETWRKARQYEDLGAIEFFDRYYECVETGFAYAINKFTH